jgi:hypothetical protein
MIEKVNTSIPEKEVIKKFEYLFGRARLLQLANMKEEMAKLGKGKIKIIIYLQIIISLHKILKTHIKLLI